MKRKNYAHQVNWVRNTYYDDKNRKHTAVTGYHKKTGQIVKRFVIRRKS